MKQALMLLASTLFLLTATTFAQDEKECSEYDSYSEQIETTKSDCSDNDALATEYDQDQNDPYSYEDDVYAQEDEESTDDIVDPYSDSEEELLEEEIDFEEEYSDEESDLPYGQSET